MRDQDNLISETLDVEFEIGNIVDTRLYRLDNESLEEKRWVAFIRILDNRLRPHISKLISFATFSWNSDMTPIKIYAPDKN